MVLWGYYIEIITKKQVYRVFYVGKTIVQGLSRDACLLAAVVKERERLKQQFAFKYLLRASGGSYDQNREWEVGNGYDDDNGRSLKR